MRICSTLAQCTGSKPQDYSSLRCLSSASRTALPVLGRQSALVHTTLVESLRPLPAEIAAEVRGFVVGVVSEGGNCQAAVQVSRRAGLAPLLMGGALFGYFLARASQSRDQGDGLAAAAMPVHAEWATEAAFVAASARIGRLLGLPPESTDPLRSYESLREVTTEIRAEPLSQVGEYFDVTAAVEGDNEETKGAPIRRTTLPKADLVTLEVEGLRGLLGEACALGYTLRIWEARVSGFVLPDQANDG